VGVINSTGPITLKGRGNNPRVGRINPFVRSVGNAMMEHVKLQEYGVMGVRDGSQD